MTLPSVLHVFWWEIWCLLTCFSLIVFISFLMMSLSVDFFGLFWLGFTQFHEHIGLCPLPNLGKLVFISSNTFKPHSLFLSFWDSRTWTVDPFLILRTFLRFYISFFFFSLFVLCFASWLPSIFPLSSPISLSFVSLLCWWAHPLKFFSSIIICLTSKSSIWFFFILI